MLRLWDQKGVKPVCKPGKIIYCLEVSMFGVMPLRTAVW